VSFVFAVTKPLPVGTISVEVRNPEFGDVHSFPRRQATGVTEGGRQYVQDLGVDEQFYQATWANLTRCERRDLEYFFGVKGSNKRQHVFTMSVVNNANLAFPIGSGQGYNTGQQLNSGSLVVPATASFGLVRLDQGEVSFVATPRDRYTTTLRFRILNPNVC